MISRLIFCGLLVALLVPAGFGQDRSSDSVERSPYRPQPSRPDPDDRNPDVRPRRPVLPIPVPAPYYPVNPYNPYYPYPVPVPRPVNPWIPPAVYPWLRDSRGNVVRDQYGRPVQASPAPSYQTQPSYRRGFGRRR